MADHPYSPPALALRCGRLESALAALLEVIDDMTVALDALDEITVRHARRELDESGDLPQNLREVTR